MASQKTPANVSEEQLQEIYEAFCHFDRDGSGSIDVEELGHVLKSLGQIVTDEEIAEIVRTIDTDENGTIDLQEFVQLMVGLMNQPVSTDEIKAAFEVFDTEKQGFLTATELKRILTTMGEKMTEEEADEMIREADMDGDGHIDYKEFAAFLAKKD